MSEPTTVVAVERNEGETLALAAARVLSIPFLRHGAITGNIANNLIAESPDNPSRASRQQ